MCSCVCKGMYESESVSVRVCVCVCKYMCVSAYVYVSACVKGLFRKQSIEYKSKIKT